MNNPENTRKTKTKTNPLCFQFEVAYCVEFVAFNPAVLYYSAVLPPCACCGSVCDLWHVVVLRASLAVC
jgi:hypothetical protein